MKRLTRPVWVVLALLFLFEAWLWDRLAPIVARIVAAIPWGWVKPSLIRLVDRLSPQATLAVFVIPFIVLLPLKFLEFWFLAHRGLPSSWFCSWPSSSALASPRLYSR